jgi:tetratricopeptide (TPR) repeat protein
VDKKQSWLSNLFGTTRQPPAPAVNATQRSALAAPAATSPNTESYAPGDAHAPWTEGLVLLDDFVVECELGEGGMGKVYLVRSRATGHPFAVKKAKFRDETSRRNFLGELQAWIDLPEHPHLAACRFFRTVGDAVAIFGEYVEGGSLAAWIRDGRVTDLALILDLAIQFAWGLHAAHEAGLIHQDAKPGNVLLTSDGRAKVADFGLARARARAGEEGPTGWQSVLVSWGGMTPAYCSPEQASGRRLTRRTDVWSWGVSLLELFTGQVTWQRGTEAVRTLEGYLTAGPADARLPRMPVAVADVLRGCFRDQPDRRWATLAEVADALRAIYFQVIGRPYPRPVPSFPPPRGRTAVAQDRWTPFAGPRADPREWLLRAFREAGRNPAEAEALLPVRIGSRAAQVVGDLAVYEEAVHVFVRLVSAGRKDLEPVLAELLSHKALVHRHADDIPGALTLYDRCTELYQRLVHLEGHAELAGSLAAVHQAKAEALGNRPEALTVYDAAIALRRRLAEQDGRPNRAGELALAYLGKARAVADLGDAREAATLYDRVVALLEPLADRPDAVGLANLLGRAYLGKARAVADLGEPRTAAGLCDRAIQLYQRPQTHEGRRDLANDLAGTFASKARAVADLGDARAAVGLYNRAILLYKRLVDREDRRELTDDYADACASKASAVADLGDLRLAGRLYAQAVGLLERLVNQEGRHDRSADLARTYLGQAGVLAELGDRRGALPRYDQALAIFDRLIQQEDRREHNADVIRACLGRASVLTGLGDPAGAVASYDHAIALLEREVHAEGHDDRRHDLAAAHAGKARAVAAAGNLAAAVELYDQAIAGWEHLVRQTGPRKAMRHLAKAKAIRAALLIRMDDLDAAAVAAREAVALLQSEIARTGRADLQKTLKWAANALRKVL